MERTFTVTKVSTTTGRIKSSENIGGIFKNKTPVAAAKKAVSRICRKSSIKGRCTLIVTVQEQQDGKVKDFSYKISRVVKPITVVHNGKEIKRNFALKAKAIK